MKRTAREFPAHYAAPVAVIVSVKCGRVAFPVRTIECKRAKARKVAKQWERLSAGFVAFVV